MEKKEKKVKGGPVAGEDTVELHLPANVYARGEKLWNAEADNALVKQLLRSMFPRDDLYGIKKVRFVLKTFAPPKVGKHKPPFKDCEITLGP
jgi:hypothetical protein